MTMFLSWLNIPRPLSPAVDTTTPTNSVHGRPLWSANVNTTGKSPRGAQR
jgi:hypothetical protein